MSLQHEKPTAQPDERSDHQPEHSPVLTAQNARQGATGHNVRYVLGLGMLAVIVAFFAIYLAYFA
jgi:hypothetical protein